MRSIFQCAVVLLAVAIFPLPSDENISTARYFSQMAVLPQDRVPLYAEVPEHLRLTPIAEQVKTRRLEQARTVSSTGFRLQIPGTGTTHEEGNYVVSSRPVNRSVLLIGDSLSIPLGQRLEEHFLKTPGLAFQRYGKVSSGLARPDFFDWEAGLTSLTRSMRPDTVMIMLGTNDTQSLKSPDGRVHHFGDTGWEKEYGRRMQRLFDICRASNPKARIYWIGAPIMGKPKLAQDVKAVNLVARSRCERTRDCHFVDTWAVLADREGNYLAAADIAGERVRLRSDDGIHLSGPGARLLTDRFISAMGQIESDQAGLTAARPAG